MKKQNLCALSGSSSSFAHRHQPHTQGLFDNIQLILQSLRHILSETDSITSRKGNSVFSHTCISPFGNTDVTDYRTGNELMKKTGQCVMG